MPVMIFLFVFIWFGNALLHSSVLILEQKKPDLYAKNKTGKLNKFFHILLRFADKKNI